MIGTPGATDRAHHEAEVSTRLFGATDIGQVSQQNQDAFGFSGDGRVLVVADGMGGYDFGDISSLHAVESVLGYVADQPAAEFERAPGAVLMAAVESAHQQLSAEAARDPLLRKTGTTLLVATVVGDMFYTCHVGDSRAYLLTGSRLHQVTRDHSMVEVLVRSGQITAGQARFHPQKNKLTQAVGLSQIIAPTVNELQLTAGDRVLLCSDGLWGPLPENEIQERLQASALLAEAGRDLIEGANLFGGRDNITAALYQHGNDEG